MRKNITAVCLSACVLMSACSAGDENASEVTAESMTEISDIKTETTADPIKEDNVTKYETMSGAEPDKSDMADDTAGKFADIICGMTENGDYGAAGSTFGFADMNSDGIPELIRRDSMRAGIEVFDINGNSIWKNSFDPPYEMSLTECTDSKTGEKVFIYSGYTEHANYAYYTAEAICRPEKMTVIAVYDADSGELVKLEAAASDDDGSDIASADISETSYSEEEVRKMYSEYFGGYVPVSGEDIWDSIRIKLSGEMKDSAFRGELRGHFDELREMISDALNRSDRDGNAVFADKNTSEIIPPDADKISEIFDMRMSETEWKDGGKLGLSGSASGYAEAYYTDIDCDGGTELCVLIAGTNTSNMYIYSCDKTGEWSLKDRLHVTPQYMYYYDDADGESAFMSVDSEERHVFRLYSYKNGITDDIETFSDNGGMHELNYYADDIEKRIGEFDGVSDLHDLPHASTNKYYEINVNGDSAELENFTAELMRIISSRGSSDIEIFQNHDWQTEYEKYLNDNISDDYAAPAYGFNFLYTDIDGDSGYELIAGLKNMNGHSADTLLIYDIIGEKPCCLGKMYGETEVTDAENAPDFFDGMPLKMYRGNGGTKLLSYTEERHGGQYYCIISAAEIGGKFGSDIIAYKCGSGDESFYSLEIFGDKISDSDFEKLISNVTAGYEEYSSALPEIREMTELNTSR